MVEETQKDGRVDGITGAGGGRRERRRGEAINIVPYTNTFCITDTTKQNPVVMKRNKFAGSPKTEIEREGVIILLIYAVPAGCRQDMKTVVRTCFPRLGKGGGNVSISLVLSHL